MFAWIAASRSRITGFDLAILITLVKYREVQFAQSAVSLCSMQEEAFSLHENVTKDDGEQSGNYWKMGLGLIPAAVAVQDTDLQPHMQPRLGCV